MHLVVVESPAKAKTIKKHLGANFEVLASYGHVRDLVPKNGAVDTEHGFQMRYQVLEKSNHHLQAIYSLVKKAESLYLATDPDREGEAIAWHLYEILQNRGLLENKVTQRIAFHEITQRAIQDALANPRSLSMPLINAQQARRALDYLVGFNLSPLLWKKIRRGLSAGRVQSPALRLIVEREQDIENFVIREYWSIEADLVKDKQIFDAKLIQFQGQRVEQFTISDVKQAEKVNKALKDATTGKLTVEQIEHKQRKRNPAPPFTTSTLQQEAARKLGFTTQRTMRIAQQLYEGIEISGDAVGLITYMRTDSVTLAQEALEEIRLLITQRYGPQQVPESPRIYKTKAKNAQEAHEAIRPTSVLKLPADLIDYLTKEQLKLYELIWKCTVACQMQHATFNTVAVNLNAGTGNTLRATGSVIVDPGFMQVYLEGQDDAKGNDADEDTMLPNLVQGEQITLTKLRTEQHFTEPPARYTEASLVRALEEHGIGRPSTYASIISTLQEREYAQLDDKRFIPTDTGIVVNRFLTAHFTQYVDYDFTARLEDELDAVSRGEMEWLPLLERFWQPFKTKIEHVDSSVSRSEVTQEAIDESCTKCGSPLSIRLGKRGRFVGCTKYPECDYTRDLDNSKSVDSVIIGKNCPKCDAALVIKQGRYGAFIGCSAYPNCNHMEPLEQPQDTGVACPKCNEGQMVRRKSQRGKVFYSCATYPKCNYAVWDQPLGEPCPNCNWPMLTMRVARNGTSERVCPQKDCGFKEIYEI